MTVRRTSIYWRTMARKIRVVIAKPGLDGHDRGAKIIARALRDAGMEVIYTGLHQTPEQIVETAIQEDADAVGISILSGAHMTLVPRILEGLRENGVEDVLVVVGGTIPRDDVLALKEQGVAEIFTPGAPVTEIVEFLRANVPARSMIDVERVGGTAIVTVNRPEAMNALDLEHAEALQDTFAELAADEAVRVVVLTGGGEKAFIAGADIKYMQALGVLEARRWGELGHACGNLLETMPKPTIAAINGFALGGGCELALACDLRLASSNARIGQPEIDLGILPGWGGSVRLARTTTLGFAKALIFTGRPVDAAEALEHGLVNAVYEPGGAAREDAGSLPGPRGEEPARARVREGGGQPRAPGPAPDEPRHRGAPLRHALRERRPEGGHGRVRREAAAPVSRLGRLAGAGAPGRGLRGGREASTATT